MLYKIFSNELYREKLTHEREQARHVVSSWLKESLYNGEEDQETNKPQLKILLEHFKKKGYDLDKIMDLYEDRAPTPLYIKKLLKQQLEVLAYLIEIKEKKLIDNAIGGRQLACGEGSLSAIQNTILALNSSVDLNSISIASKREVLQLICVDFLRSGEFAALRLSELRTPGMETHDVSALLNILSADYGLIAKKAEEDVHMEFISSNEEAIKGPLKQYVESQLSTQKYEDIFFGGIVNKLSLLLDITIDKNREMQQGPHNTTIDPLLEVFESTIRLLKINDLKVQHILNFDNSIIQGYKKNWSDILQDIVRNYFEKEGFVKHDELRELRIQFQLGTFDDGRSLLEKNTHISPIINDANKLKYMLLYAIQYDLKFFPDLDSKSEAQELTAVGFILSDTKCKTVLQNNIIEFFNSVFEYGSIKDIQLLIKNISIEAVPHDANFYLKIASRDNLEIASDLIEKQFDLLDFIREHKINCPNILKEQTKNLDNKEKTYVLDRYIRERYNSGIKFLIEHIELNKNTVKDVLSYTLKKPGDFELLKLLIDTSNQKDEILKEVFQIKRGRPLSLYRIQEHTSKEFILKFINEYLAYSADNSIINQDLALLDAHELDLNSLKAIINKCPSWNFSASSIHRAAVNKESPDKACLMIEQSNFGHDYKTARIRSKFTASSAISMSHLLEVCNIEVAKKIISLLIEIRDNDREYTPEMFLDSIRRDNSRSFLYHATQNQNKEVFNILLQYVIGSQYALDTLAPSIIDSLKDGSKSEYITEMLNCFFNTLETQKEIKNAIINDPESDKNDIENAQLDLKYYQRIIIEIFDAAAGRNRIDLLDQWIPQHSTNDKEWFIKRSKIQIELEKLSDDLNQLRLVCLLGEWDYNERDRSIILNLQYNYQEQIELAEQFDMADLAKKHFDNEHYIYLNITASHIRNLQMVEEKEKQARQERQERIKQEKAEQEKAAQERAAQEKAAQEKAAQEKAEREQAAREQAEREQAEREQAEREQAEREQAEREQAEREQAAQEQAAQEQAAQEKAAQEKRQKMLLKASVCVGCLALLAGGIIAIKIIGYEKIKSFINQNVVDTISKHLKT